MIVVPSTPSPAGIGLDSSWVFGLNMGHFDRMIFGLDIIFTYGPLGYLVVPTFPEAEPWAVFAFLWGIALVTAYALWKLSHYAGHWTTVCLYLGVFWFWSAFALDFAPERMLAAIIALTLVIAIRLDGKPWFDLGLLFFLASAAVLTKFNLGGHCVWGGALLRGMDPVAPPVGDAAGTQAGGCGSVSLARDTRRAVLDVGRNTLGTCRFFSAIRSK